jgi:ATP-binding cassette subfamily B protein
MLFTARRLLKLGKPPAWSMVVISLTILLTSIVSVLPPLFIGRMVDALQHREFVRVFAQLGAYLGVTLLLNGVQLGEGYSSTVFRESVTRNLRIALLVKLNRVRFDALAQLTPGAISNRAIGGISALAVQLQYSIFPTLLSLCTLVATVAAILRLDVRLAGAALFFAVFTLLPPRLTSRPTAALQKRQAEAMDDLSDELQESSTLQGLALLRNPSAQGRRLERFATVAGKIFRFGVLQSLLTDGTALVSTLLNSLGPVAIMAIGALLVVRGQITVGTIVTVLIYQSRMTGPFGTLASLQLTFAAARVVAERLLEVLDLPEEHSGDQPFSPGALVMRDVSVTRERRTTLDEVTLDVPAGAHIAIVGPSAAGKSTLVSLLLRFAPYTGLIEIGGVDLTDVDLDSLRRCAAIVAQDPLILNATLRENLTLMRDRVSEAELNAVIELCAMDAVVARLPRGMETVLGHRGFRLSGGERQRICLARAVLQDPALLVLDEALSGVDLETEGRIVTALRARFRDRMLIAITHRVASVAGFDRVFVLREGRLVDSQAAAAL